VHGLRGCFVPAMTMDQQGLQELGWRSTGCGRYESSTQAAVEQELRASGMTDDYRLRCWRGAGNKAAIKTAITMPIYIGTGKLAAGLTAKALPHSPGCCVCSTNRNRYRCQRSHRAAMRALEGEDAMPNLEQFTRRAVGVIQGSGESSKASAKAVEKLVPNCVAVGGARSASTPLRSTGGTGEDVPRTGTGWMQFPVPRGSEPAPGRRRSRQHQRWNPLPAAPKSPSLDCSRD